MIDNNFLKYNNYIESCQRVRMNCFENKNFIFSHIFQNSLKFQQPNSLSQDTGDYIRKILIKKGQKSFNQYLTQINFTQKSKGKMNKKNDKKNPLNKKNHPNSQQQTYSIYNLIKFEQKNEKMKQITNKLLASELIKTNYSSYQDQKVKIFKNTSENEQDSLIFYKDLQKTQKFNRKIINYLIKPSQLKLQSICNQLISVKIHQLLQSQCQNTFKSMKKDKNDQKEEIKMIKMIKMNTKKEYIQILEEKIVMFSGELKKKEKKNQFDDGFKQFTNQLILSAQQCMRQQNKRQQKDIFVFSLVDQFKQKIQSYLPEFLINQNQIALSLFPSAQIFVQKQLHKNFKEIINGKILYKYEQKLDDIKSNSLIMIMFKYENSNKVKNKVDVMKSFLYKSKGSYLIKGKNNISCNIVMSENVEKNNLINQNSLGKIKTQQKLISQKQKGFEKLQIIPQERLHQIQNLTNFIPQKPPTKIPNNNFNQILEQFKDSKNFKALPYHQNKSSQNFLQSRRVYYDPQIQYQKNYKKKLHFYDEQVNIQQQKTVKKSRRLEDYSRREDRMIKRSYDQSQFQIENDDRSTVVSDFYPIKCQNLVIEFRQVVYLQYHCKKIPIKNLLVTFLIDRLTYGVNEVILVISSLNPQKLTLTQSQSVKSMIKIIASVGGQILGVKEQAQCINQGKNSKDLGKIVNELMMCKHLFNELSYGHIIEALALDRETQKQRNL